MSFAQYPEHTGGIELLQRSLERGRLGHAYLFCGNRLETLEAIARTLAKTLNCEQRQGAAAVSGPPDSCDHCESCRKIGENLHPDVVWVRPESKSRVITIDQMRDVMHTMNLKPTQAAFKVGVIVSAERLNVNAANAFLKTLEEPPARSILVLLSTDPAHLLETILSRCLRLNFAGEESHFTDAALVGWLKEFSDTAVNEQGSLLSRYRLLSVLLKRLAAMKEQIERRLKALSPLERYDDVEPELQEKWEEELAAAIEAEYRRQRADLLIGLQWWLRDVWLQTLTGNGHRTAFPALEVSSKSIAKRVSPPEAMENLRVIERTQWLLGSNTQEALALEVGLLKLKL
ncbi:MAG: DNA polymerase III subunit [Verrucomicrobia bacterium]|nr:DNA polymerase III subunit [Verrucomicrobiota bacterium]